MRLSGLFLLIPCIILLPIFLYQTTNGGKLAGQLQAYTKVNCFDLLQSLNTLIPIIIIDEIILEQIEANNCLEANTQKIKIGVDISFISSSYLTNDPRFEVFYFKNDSSKDYVAFETEPKRIIPKLNNLKRYFNVYYPSDTTRFLEYWKRSKFIDCLNLFIPRNTTNYWKGSPAATRSLAVLRDLLLDYNMFAFLNGGTLLGWYRECTIIPHTHDMDLAVFAEQYNDNFTQHLINGTLPFKIKRKFGKPDDSQEMTVQRKQGSTMLIDIFFMYSEKNENGTFSYVGGHAPDGSKFKYTYPPYNPYCAADLHGHIFWITCTPLEMLKHEYGKLWYMDHPTSKYSWSSSSFNVKRNGKWKKEEMKDVYIIF
ncbi:unnamed protein product [Caenorhabditis bovis]|uniref:W02B3.4-like N-terminal domain-containing protein n=1 Tax=Caenorhabditis bovis TaxID=2654633 RepID=A0A8S1ERT6_9PELO|nr:unnamed protein product [Caenorhabditis bovis]